MLCVFERTPIFTVRHPLRWLSSSSHKYRRYQRRVQTSAEINNSHLISPLHHWLHSQPRSSPPPTNISSISHSVIFSVNPSLHQPTPPSSLHPSVSPLVGKPSKPSCHLAVHVLHFYIFLLHLCWLYLCSALLSQASLDGDGGWRWEVGEVERGVKEEVG